MSLAKRDNNFTKKHLRGIDMVINQVMKKYTFIKGWKLSPVYDKFAVTLYVDIYIDFFELADKYGYGVLNYWKREILQDPEKNGVGALSGYIGHKDGTSVDWNSPEREEIFNKYYKLSSEIKEYANKLYLHLPDEYIIKWDTNLESISPSENLMPISISFDNYIQKI